jgi:hypothetical protein
VDPGTYSYNAQGVFSDAFASARVHSVPLVNETEPARRLSRFLFQPWPRGRAGFEPVEERFSAAHDGYAKQGVQLLREVRALGPNRFEITDRIHASVQARVALHWLLADLGWTRALATGSSGRQRPAMGKPGAGEAGAGETRASEHGGGTYTAVFEGTRVLLRWQASCAASDESLVSAAPDSDRGWQSTRYLQLAPACSLRLDFSVRGILTVRTQLWLETVPSK